jgi:2-C-methyl-D-erythritol 4-phosphate cytidylyltransferase
VWVIVVAAGSGTRFGRPKQFEMLGGQRVVDWSLRTASMAADGTVAVVPADAVADPMITSEATAVVAGGESRSASVRAGLAAVPIDVEVICVHDGARPLAGPGLYAAVVDAVRSGADCAVPATEVTDTLKTVDRSTDPAEIRGTVDRRDLAAVQTPQAFPAHVLRAAHADGPDATDDAGLVEAGGGRVVAVTGDVTNIKITEPIDLAIAQLLLDRP